MSNLNAATREAWDRTVYDEVMMKLVLVRMLIERKQVAFKGGTSYKFTADMAEMDDLAQEYGNDEPLTSGTKTMYQTVEFKRKRVQIPVKYSGEEELDNGDGGDGVIFDLKERLVRKAHRAMRLYLNKKVFEAGSATSDSDKGFQGLADALTHNLTYGGKTRATTVTNQWWQGASLDATYNDYNAATSCSIANFRKCVDAVSSFYDSPSELIAITSNENFRSLQSQVQTGSQGALPGPHAKYGFTSMDIDGVEVFAEPWLSSSLNSAAATTKKYFFMLNLNTWKLCLSPKRKFGTLQPFTWQGQVEGGKDEYLSRVLLAGNLFCTNPNANIFRSNME